MRIGKVSLSSDLFLAPLHGVTCSAFRILCKKYGAGLTYAPILNENSLINNASKVIDVLPEESPVAGQLIGNDSLKLSKAAMIIEPFFDIIDLNFGCPRPKEVRCNIGAVLLQKHDKVGKLVSSLVKSVSKPVTVKVRLGYNKINVLEIAKIVEGAGASAIAVHARTAMQDYGVPADWSWIKKVKESVSIPVIGNGDVFSYIDALRMKEVTGCDAVMIGRAANGNPFIFGNVIPSDNDRINAFKEFSALFKGPIHELKIHAINFIKGMVNSKELRNKIMHSRSINDLMSLFD